MWGFISNTCDDLLLKIRTVLWQKIIITDDYTLSIFAILMKVLWFKDLLNNNSHGPLTKDNTMLLFSCGFSPFSLTSCDLQESV